MTREYMMALGFSMIVAGQGAYDRYMVSLDGHGAGIGLFTAFVGVWVMAKGLRVEVAA